MKQAQKLSFNGWIQVSDHTFSEEPAKLNLTSRLRSLEYLLFKSKELRMKVTNYST